MKKLNKLQLPKALLLITAINSGQNTKKHLEGCEEEKRMANSKKKLSLGKRNNTV